AGHVTAPPFLYLTVYAWLPACSQTPQTLARCLLSMGEGGGTSPQQEADESPTYAGHKTKRGSTMRTVIGPREEGSVATVETSGGEDTAPATITTTLHDLISALQQVGETGSDGLCAASLRCLMCGGRSHRLVRGWGQESVYAPGACRRQSARAPILA